MQSLDVSRPEVAQFLEEILFKPDVIRMAKTIPDEVLNELVVKGDIFVQEAVARRREVKPAILTRLAAVDDEYVLTAVAESPNINHEVVSEIFKNRMRSMIYESLFRNESIVLTDAEIDQICRDPELSTLKLTTLSRRYVLPPITIDYLLKKELTTPLLLALSWQQLPGEIEQCFLSSDDPALIRAFIGNHERAVETVEKMWEVWTSPLLRTEIAGQQLMSEELATKAFKWATESEKHDLTHILIRKHPVQEDLVLGWLDKAKGAYGEESRVWHYGIEGWMESKYCSKEGWDRLFSQVDLEYVLSSGAETTAYEKLGTTIVESNKLSEAQIKKILAIKTMSARKAEKIFSNEVLSSRTLVLEYPKWKRVPEAREAIKQRLLQSPLVKEIEEGVQFASLKGGKNQKREVVWKLLWSSLSQRYSGNEQGL